MTGATALAGVVGRPVRHSLSPTIHNAWLETAGLDGIYVALEPGEGGFGRLVEGLRGGSALGLNVTLPFKQEALRLADVADEAARRAGAANLLLFRNGGIEARNTDGLGLLAALDEGAPGWRDNGPAVVLGAGGAARGAAAALLGAGVRVRVANRTPERAKALVAEIEGGAEAVRWAGLASALAGAGLLVNATSAGLKGRGELDLPWEAVSPSLVVMDMVYRPLRTAVLARAEERGCRTVDGLAMLIGQAVPSFEALFGHRPPSDVNVRTLALEALGEGG